MRVRWKDFELPTRVVLDEATSTPTYGKFYAEPFERGFGTTVGNSLRRVLYSSIAGSAVTGMKIKGVSHEFSTIEGVVEDVTDIVLNLKQLVLKIADDQTKKLKLEVSAKGPVRASQFQPEAGVEVANPDLLLFTLAEDTTVSIELEARKGRRYVTAEEHIKDGREHGWIPIDSSFSPVQRVRYGIENTRVGKQTNYDRLVLEVWTNGTVSPEECVVEASKILRKHLNPFVQYFELGRELQINERKEEEMRKKEKEKEELRSKLSMSISELVLVSPNTVCTCERCSGSNGITVCCISNSGNTLKQLNVDLGTQGLSSCKSWSGA